MAQPLDPDRYRTVFGHFATGVAVITVAGSAGEGGLTANAVCSVSLDPLLALVCFEQRARTLPLVREAGRFAVNVLRAGAEAFEQLRNCGPPLGIIEGTTYRDAGAVALAPGDLMFLYTDGVTEAREIGQRQARPGVDAGAHHRAAGRVGRGRGRSVGGLRRRSPGFGLRASGFGLRAQ